MCESVEATPDRAVDYLFLLALIVCLGRMLVSCLGFLNGLSGLLLRAHMVVGAVLLRGGPVGFRGLFVMFRCGLVHIFWHGDFSLSCKVRMRSLKRVCTLSPNDFISEQKCSLWQTSPPRFQDSSLPIRHRPRFVIE